VKLLFKCILRSSENTNNSNKKDTHCIPLTKPTKFKSILFLHFIFKLRVSAILSLKHQKSYLVSPLLPSYVIKYKKLTRIHTVHICRMRIDYYFDLRLRLDNVEPTSLWNFAPSLVGWPTTPSNFIQFSQFPGIEPYNLFSKEAPKLQFWKVPPKEFWYAAVRLLLEQVQLF